MFYQTLLGVALTVGLLAAPARADWDLKLAKARAALEQGVTPARLQVALDAAYRADNWKVGADLAGQVPDDAPVALRGLALRALWRAGVFDQAARLAETLPDDIRDPETLCSLAIVRLAEGRWNQADRLLDQLERVGPTTAFQIYTIVTARMQRGQTQNLGLLMRKAAALIDPEAGYPNAFLAESTEGLPDLADAIGERGLNRTTRFGAAAMPALPGLGLPSVQVFLNGKGPYNLLLDTGGSVTLSLDEKAAREVGLPEVAQSKIHGVGGAQDAFMSIIDNVQMGEVQLERVMCHAFEMPELLGGVHGILGTGVFLNDRFTLDFQTGQVRVAKSDASAGEGDEVALWITSDAKLLAWVQLNDEPGVALIDSGADSSVLSSGFARTRFRGRSLFETPLPDMAGVGEGQGGSLMFVPAVDLKLGGHTPEGFGGLALSTLDDMLSPIIGVQCDALIGMNILRQMRSFTVDGPRSRGWITWIE